MKLWEIALILVGIDHSSQAPRVVPGTIWILLIAVGVAVMGFVLRATLPEIPLRPGRHAGLRA